jgi:hypothetical protein
MITAAVIRLYSLRAMRTRRWLGLTALVLVVTAASQAAGLEPRAGRLDGDRAAVLQYRAGLRDVVTAVDFVLFLDGQERAGVAVERLVGEFRRSWQRPKWRLRPDG